MGAVGEEQPGDGDAVAHYPAAEGVTSTQILTLVRAARGALGDIVEALSAGTRVSDGLPDRASALAAMHFPHRPRTSRSGGGAWRSRSCC